MYTQMLHLFYNSISNIYFIYCIVNSRLHVISFMMYVSSVCSSIVLNKYLYDSILKDVSFAEASQQPGSL
jgi:hypothetical protein